MNALLSIEPVRTVVLTIDMQRDYLDPGFASSPLVSDDAERVLRHTTELLAFARGEGIPVIHYGQRRRVEIERGAFGGQLRKFS